MWSLGDEPTDAEETACEEESSAEDDTAEDETTEEMAVEEPAASDEMTGSDSETKAGDKGGVGARSILAAAVLGEADEVDTADAVMVDSAIYRWLC